MTRNTIIAAVLSVTLAGCATAFVDDGAQPSAAIREALQPLAGHWQGTVWETGSVFYQGRAALDIRIGSDGRWTGTIGRDPASGVAGLQGRWLVLSGTVTGSGGHRQPVYYELTGDDHRRWGEIASPFAGGDGQGRVEHATVSLDKVPERESP